MRRFAIVWTVACMSVGGAAAEDGPLTTMGAVDCGAADQMVLENVLIEVGPGEDAITAGGACVLTVINSQISGGGTGIWVGGAAQVLVSGSTVSGGDEGMWVAGGSDARIENSTLTGGDVGLSVSGGAKAGLFETQINGGTWTGGAGQIIQSDAPFTTQ